MFLADDERSDTDEDDDMASVNSTLDGEGRAGEPRYPGEDTRPTSNKELAGWYAYAFAAEVYVICGTLHSCAGLGCPG
jgi:UMF1 family MFS transporter